ncbi:hypothetical protein F5Y10DRAFT_273509 [Nemania abortiva]|nr:hypothetical protein F5Y10DRAFT_273509 [Nemania abortiva]
MANFDNARSLLPTEALQTPKFQNAQKTWKNLSTIFTSHPFLEYKKVLGFGGFGIVQQWSTYNTDGTMGDDIAIKGTIEAGRMEYVNGLKNEIHWSKVFGGSEHFMQLKDIRSHPLTDGIYNDEKATLPIMIMEVMPNGCLADVIDRLRVAKSSVNGNINDDNDKLLEYVPCRILWRIILCMTRACLGMAFPPRPNGSQSPQEIREEPKPGQAPRRIIHFEYVCGLLSLPRFPLRDSSNGSVEHFLTDVFIGAIAEVTDVEHAKFPICKWDDNWGREEKEERSKYGKRSYKPPEQMDRRRIADPGVFGVHTNVWGIGLTVMLLIRLRYHFDNGLGHSHDRKLRNGDEINTFGYTLIDDSHGPVRGANADIDLELRETVARCLAGVGSQRPTLEELYNVAIRNIQDGDQKARTPAASQQPPNPIHSYRVKLGQPEPDSLLDRFVKNFFLDAAPMADRFAPYWSKISTPEVETTSDILSSSYVI